MKFLLNHRRSISAIILILSLLITSMPFSVFANNTDDNQSNPIELKSFSDEQIRSIARESKAAVAKEIAATLTLSESDIPESMDKTDIRDTDAVVRAVGFEDDLSSCIYLNSDGTYTEYFFPENIKYESNGEIIDKSNRLYETNNGFINLKNDIRVVLPLIINKDNSITLTSNEYKLEFRPLNTCNSTEGKKSTTDSGKDSVKYYNALGDGIHLEYEALFTGIKENIIITKETDNYTFSYTIKTKGLGIKSNDLAAFIINKNGEEIASIGELIIFDSKGKPGKGYISISEVIPNEEYTYSITVDPEFVNEADTLFPITVDPTITYNYYSISDNVISTDGSVYSMSPSAGTFILGATGTSLKSRYLAKFDSAVSKVASLNSISQLYYANLYVYTTSNITSNISAKCYRMTSSWSHTATTGSSSIWNGYTTSGGASGTFTSTHNYATFNVKSIISAWCQGSNQYGVVVKVNTESGSDNRCIAHTTKTTNMDCKPQLVLRYSLSGSSVSPSNNGLDSDHLYMIHCAHGEYLTSTNVSSGNYSLSAENLNIQTGSTANKSYFFTLCDINNNYFRLSPTNGNATGNPGVLNPDSNLNYISPYYLYANTNGNVLIDQDQNQSYIDYSYWFLLSTGNNFYIVNKFSPYYYLSVFGNGTINDNQLETSNYSKWSFDTIGCAAPLYKQSTTYTCGPASVKMLLKCYDIEFTEGTTQYSFGTLQIKVNTLLSANNININYIIYGKPSSNGIINPNNLNHWDKIYNDTHNNNPGMVLIKSTSTGDLPYTTNGHYLVLKGAFETTINGVTVYYVVLNDPHYGTYQGNPICGEYVLTYTQLNTYMRNHSEGWSLMTDNII